MRCEPFLMRCHHYTVPRLMVLTQLGFACDVPLPSVWTCEKMQMLDLCIWAG